MDHSIYSNNDLLDDLNASRESVKTLKNSMILPSNNKSLANMHMSPKPFRVAPENTGYVNPIKSFRKKKQSAVGEYFSKASREV